MDFIERIFIKLQQIVHEKSTLRTFINKHIDIFVFKHLPVMHKNHIYIIEK